VKTSMLVTLLTEGFALLSVKFEKSEKSYHYKAPLAWNIQEGDTVVVESPYSGYTCVKVTGVDNEPIIDVNAGYSYKWVVQKVDPSQYLAHGEKEKLFYKHLNRLRNKALAENELNRMREMVAGTSAAKELDEALAAVANPMGAQATGGYIAPGDYGTVGNAEQATVEDNLADLTYKGKRVLVFRDHPHTNKLAYTVDGGLKLVGFEFTDLAVKHAMHSIDVGSK